MKKILFCFLGITFSMIFLTEELYAATTFFTSKDGKLFCETDSYDGSYAECNIASQQGNALTKATFPYPRLIETPTRQICVVSSIETDMDACQEEINALKKVLRNPTVQKGNTTSGMILLSESIENITASASLDIVQDKITTLVQNTPTITGDALVKLQGSLGIGWNNLQTLSRICIEDMAREKCISGIYKTRDQLLQIPIWILVTVLGLILVLSIFYIQMLFHVFSHPVSFRILWIIILLLISIPGALLYYIFAYRPYNKFLLETMPPKPPSFF